MIDSKKTIVQLDKEKIVLDELSLPDPGKSDDKNAVNNTVNREEIDTGFGMPLIKINSYVVRNLSYFKLDLAGKIPSLIFRFTADSENFLYTSYPKDGDIVCLFIRSVSQLYKPIRIDLLVTEVLNQFTPPKLGSFGKNPDKKDTVYPTFTIKAQMRIPGILQHVCKGFNNKTSFEVLREIAKELGLGFASNVKGTNDRMNWICPNKTYYKFIDDVCNSSWESEEDFFDWWIDSGYVLNFVNLKKQLLEKSKDDTQVLIPNGVEKGLGGGLTSNDKPDEYKLPLFFTNDPKYKKYPIYVRTYSVKNAAGHIVNNFGYSRDLQFYDSRLVNDRPINKYVKYSVEYITEKDLGPSSTLFKGRINEDIYKKEVKKTWVGTQYGENQHKNIQQALIQNRINRYENFKVYLETQMHSFVPWVYRGQNIPIRIVHTSATGAKYAASEGVGQPPADQNQHKLGNNIDDKFLSGSYMVMGSYVEYIENQIIQSFVLGKREWLINDGRGSDPEPVVKK
jgi:hypothetical protein